MSERLPAWFLAHGAPIHLLGKQPVRRFWQHLPDNLPSQPRAILCLSAHWLTSVPTLSGNIASPEIQCDFHGFPDELYRIQWPLQGNAVTAEWLESRLRDCLGEIEKEPERPFDHGVWVPLINSWPEPKIPIYQLSLCPELGALWHLDLGKKLSILRNEGVLIIGSGGIVHNLARIDWQASRGQSSPWAADFLQAVESSIKHHDFHALCNPWSLPHGRNCVPTIEHYLPLLVALGTGINEHIIRLYDDWEYGCLSLHSYSIT